MEMENNEPIRTPPRRRRRSKLQIFKEAYLPTIIMSVTAVMVLIFIIGGISQRKKTQGPDLSASNSNTSATTTAPTTTAPTTTKDHRDPLQLQEATGLLLQAAALAEDYDYAGAVAVLESFSGVKVDFPELAKAIEEYTDADQAMVSWSAAEAYDLSFHVLIAKPELAFSDVLLKTSYKKNFITVTEFNNILEALYAGGYILVDLDDFYSLEYNSTSGTDIYVEKQLRLPPGRKPVMLTELSASYYGYMSEGEEDGLPDGFASKLAHDGEKFYNEMVLADGSITTGAYDIVPLLENFIDAHPDFSYRDARAVIAFAGYDRILGYRINDSHLNASALQQERDGLQATVAALKAAGYKLGCYSYNNVNYTTMSAEDIQNDIRKWEEKVTPWLGAVDIMVFARESDISDEAPYTGNSKFNVLYNAGFRYFLGVGSAPWSQVADRYVRHYRLMVTGSYLQSRPGQYAELFDAASILDSARTA